MPTEKKLWIALAVLAALGGAMYLQQRKQTSDLAEHSLEGAAEGLPKITVTDDDVKKIDRVEITRGGDADGGVREDIVLVKKGEEDWAVEKPAPAKANASNVKSMLDALKRLEVKELIDSSKASYAKFKVSDDKALHAVFKKGADTAVDAYFGEDGSRGTMTRLAGKDSVFAVKGYSSYLFNRDAKSWRDKTIFKFEEKDIAKVSLSNEKGVFSFEKAGDDWKAKHGKTESTQTSMEKFDKSKLETLIRAFKALSAVDFADGKTAASTGLEKPTATLTFETAGAAAKYVIAMGAADGANRWALRNGSDEIFSISSWAGDWAVADASKFEKTEEKKGDKKDDKKTEPAAP